MDVVRNSDGGERLICMSLHALSMHAERMEVKVESEIVITMIMLRYILDNKKERK